MIPLIASARAHGPHEIGVPAARGLDQDRRRQNDARDGDHRVLHAQPEGEQARGGLVGLVADVAAGLGGAGCHGAGSRRGSTDAKVRRKDLARVARSGNGRRPPAAGRPRWPTNLRARAKRSTGAGPGPPARRLTRLPSLQDSGAAAA